MSNRARPAEEVYAAIVGMAASYWLSKFSIFHNSETELASRA